MIKRTSTLIVFAIFLSLVFSSFASAFAVDSGKKLTRGEALETIINAVKAYNPTVKETDILNNDSNNLMKNSEITKAEALVMLRRGFGKIPSPKGNDLRIGNFDPKYNDLPSWAKADIEKLQAAGILIGNADGSLGADSAITQNELDTIIKRLWRLYGSNLKDDFYSAHNKKWLDTATIPKGEASNGTFTEVNEKVKTQLEKLILDVMRLDSPKGSSEQKIKDYYNSVLDMKSRNKDAVAPLKKYIALYQKANTLRELFEADAQIAKLTGKAIIIDFDLMADTEDSAKKAYTLDQFTPTLNKGDYDDENSVKVRAFREYITKLQVLAGTDAKKAAENSKQIFEFEKILDAAMLKPEEARILEILLKSSNLNETQKIFKNVDIGKIAQDAGMEIGDNDKVILGFYDELVVLASFLKEENVELLKNYCIVQLLQKYAGVLSQDFVDAENLYYKNIYGVNEPLPIRKIALDSTILNLNEAIQQMYVGKIASQKAKQDVELMIAEFIEVYKNRIKNLDWLSELTKQKACKKLDTLTVKVGYPDKWDNVLAGVEIASYKNGGSYLENVLAVDRSYREKKIKEQKLPVDKSEWGISVYSINAYYAPSYNEIVIPMGILYSPFYDENAPREANLGGIGAVIAHEISHAFDDRGAKFDENGNMVGWWTEADQKNFQQKCAEVTAYFDGIEVAPGIYNNGALTLGENIADLGGVSCALEVAAKTSFDPRIFFESYATVWKEISTRQQLAEWSKTNVHSANMLRTNRVLQSIGSFYETYGISEQDGMFVPESERVKVW